MKSFIEDKCFIIAELSANHGGSIEVAKETIRAAKRAGADAIKLQTYTADTMTMDVKNDYFIIDKGTTWDGQYLYDLYLKAFTPWEWHKELFDLAKQQGLVCFSSPFDFSAVDFLEELNTPIYKVASFEITDIPLIKYIAAKNKPIIISTGIATIEDIELAIQTCKEAGNENVTILKCTSAYPASLEDTNLLTIPDIVERFGVNSGLSDHTLGIEAPMIAAAMGAKVIEKHFILDKSVGGPDAHFSLDENEFKQMVDAVRLAEKMMGKVDYEMTRKKKKSREFSRSLFVVTDVKKGEIVTQENIRSIRPGFGMHPKYYETVLGKTFNGAFKKGTPLHSDLIEEFQE
ncbi:pseudaminic acid synthase [Ulvibacterium marinum]|uniref:Pseudaminic acid synthase n=1 Tax=Ulvibacterium marinum TaxID=2419782 RepID=A0A3B0CF89_9FLAO|nr:pseudaminic acid synthase [Ulvibacterium marinum]RKN82769.1 pseudaminic acid synthase [Ulvibacterium marinum]